MTKLLLTDKLMLCFISYKSQGRQRQLMLSADSVCSTSYDIIQVLLFTGTGLLECTILQMLMSKEWNK